MVTLAMKDLGDDDVRFASDQQGPSVLPRLSYESGNFNPQRPWMLPPQATTSLPPACQPRWRAKEECKALPTLPKLVSRSMHVLRAVHKEDCKALLFLSLIYGSMYNNEQINAPVAWLAHACC